MQILLVKTSSLGDVIHNLPVVSDIQTRFPNATIDWVVEEHFASIPRLHPAVRQTICVAVRRWRRTVLRKKTWQEIFAFKDRLNTQHYDYVLDTQGLVKSAVIARMAKGKHLGYAAEAAREPFAARFYDQHFVVPKGIHAVERNRWLAAAALGYELDLPLHYGIKAPPLTAAWLPNTAYCVCLTATSRDDKLWANEHWIVLGKALAAKNIHCIFPAGSPAERQRAETLAASLPRATVAPPLSIDALASIIAGSRGVVGVDTGLTHLAAALGIPVVALYCSTDPTLTGALTTTPSRNLGTIGTPPSPEAVLSVLQEFGI